MGRDRPLCSDCKNAFLGISGVFCRVFNEDIHNEYVAEECPEWNPWKKRAATVTPLDMYRHRRQRS